MTSPAPVKIFYTRQYICVISQGICALPAGAYKAGQFRPDGSGMPQWRPAGRAALK